MQRSRMSALATVLMLALLGAACSSNEGDSSGAAAGGGEQAAGAPASFDVTLTDFKIDPSSIAAPSGAALTFNVANDGMSPHTFAVKAGDQTYETPQIEAGSTGTVEVPALDAGEYQILCTIPGHDQLGMTGTLSVAAGSSGGTAAAGSATPSAMPSMTAEQMAAGHKKGVEDFVGQIQNGPLTKTLGNQPMKPKMDGNVKVYRLTVTELQWEVAPGQMVDAMAFNGQVPGPRIDVNEGDRLRFVVTNQLSQPFVLHFHGLTIPNAMDGVPFVTQDPIMPGDYFTYEFTVKDPPGMYVYHSHFNSAEQVGKGLYGALIVHAKSGGWASVYGAEPQVEYSMFLGDGPLGYNLNGKSFPATEPIVAQKNDWVLIHIANDGSLLHPMHLHGYHFEVVGEDGYPLSAANRYMADTLVVAPGSRFDILVHAVYPGAWAFHCHILPHAEGPDGMFGMVTALVVV